MVQVHVAHRERVNLVVRQRLLVLQHFQNMAPVEQPGEIIADRQVTDLFQGVRQRLVLYRQAAPQAVHAAAGHREAQRHQGKDQPLQQLQAQAQPQAPRRQRQGQHQRVADAGEQRQRQQRAGAEPERHQQQQREEQNHGADARLVHGKRGDQKGDHQAQGHRHGEAGFPPFQGGAGFDQQQIHHRDHRQRAEQQAHVEPAGVQRAPQPQRHHQQRVKQRHRRQGPTVAKQQTPLTDRQPARPAPITAVHGGPAVMIRSRPAALA